MSSEAKSGADWASPTVDELISHLRSSFFPLEFDDVAKTLTDREACMEQKYLDLKLKAKEEIDRLFSENVKLSDELKVKESEIDGVMKVNADFMEEFRVYEKQVLEIIELRKKGEEEKGLLVSENLKLNEELKTKQKVIDAVKRVNAENGIKIRVFEKRYIDELDLKTKVENEKRLLVSENLKLKDELKMKQNKIDAATKLNAEYEEKVRGYDKLSLDYVEFKAKVEEEKRLLVSDNQKLNDDLKMKQKGIDAAMKLNAEYEKKVRVYEKRLMDHLELKRKADEEKELLVSENLNCASESSRKFSEKESFKRKKEHNLREIIEIDDDDDDLESVSRSRRRHTSNEKTELKYTSRLFKTCQNKSDQFFPNSKGQEKKVKLIEM